MSYEVTEGRGGCLFFISLSLFFPLSWLWWKTKPKSGSRAHTLPRDQNLMTFFFRKIYFLRMYDPWNIITSNLNMFFVISTKLDAVTYLRPPRFLRDGSIGAGRGLIVLTGGGSWSFSSLASMSAFRLVPVVASWLSWKLSTREARAHLADTNRAAFFLRSWKMNR